MNVFRISHSIIYDKRPLTKAINEYSEVCKCHLNNAVYQSKIYLYRSYKNYLLQCILENRKYEKKIEFETQHKNVKD